jgi:AraC-like DNA-binding protein
METRPQAQLFTFRPIPVIAEMVRAAGLDVAELLREAELPLEAANGEITAPLGRVQAFLDLCADRLAAPLLGMDVADKIPRGMFGMMEFVIRAAPTIKQGIEALCELAPLVNPLNEMRYVADQRGCEVHISYGAFRDALGVHLNEYTVTVIAGQFSVVLGAPLALHHAWFAHGRRDHADEVARRLSCSVRFQAPDCGFAVAGDVIEKQTSSADPALFEFLLAQARAQLSHVGRNDVVAQVVRVIESRFGIADLGAGAIAQALSTTQRSLQRHLADAGTSFRDVLAHVRRRRRAELERYQLSEADIATRLGFASARSMKRSLDEGGDDE